KKLEYVYELVLIEDLNDGRYHDEFDIEDPKKQKEIKSKLEQPNVSIPGKIKRIPVTSISRLFYNSSGSLLNIEELKKVLGPNVGIIERDDEGNIVNVIIGEDEDENEVFDKKIQPEPAKTEIVKALEEEASKVFKHEKYQSEGEIEFVKKMIERYGEDYDAMFKDIKLN
ncbi:21752_t:CDS:2, partial [Entrophospora sp. SA101]